MVKQAVFTAKQYEFSAHIRHPELNPCPVDVEARRMKVYSDLFYNNVEGFIANAYPVLREIHDDASWHLMVRDYFHTHKAKTPLFPEMPREFLYYLEHERNNEANDFPFLLELAHYEWAEMALSLSEQEVTQQTVPENTEDLLEVKPVLSPLAWPLSYQWPVHQISPDYLPAICPDKMTYLLLYRDNDFEIHFMELNPVTARLLQLIAEGSLNSGLNILQQIATELNHTDPQSVVQGGISIMHDLIQRDVILI